MRPGSTPAARGMHDTRYGCWTATPPVIGETGGGWAAGGETDTRSLGLSRDGRAALARRCP